MSIPIAPIWSGSISQNRIPGMSLKKVQMDNGMRHLNAAPALQPNPKSQVNILDIAEKTFVEAANGPKNICSEKRGRRAW